jgi:hypothetical protein
MPNFNFKRHTFLYCGYKMIKTNFTSHKTNQSSTIIELITSICVTNYYKCINTKCMLHIWSDQTWGGGLATTLLVDGGVGASPFLFGKSLDAPTYEWWFTSPQHMKVTFLLLELFKIGQITSWSSLGRQFSIMTVVCLFYFDRIFKKSQ